MMKTLQSRLSKEPTTETEARIRELGPWFHNIRLPDGTETAPDHPLGDFPRFKWDQIRPCIPEDLKGWSVLDIGCNAGFYSLELARRGASVTGIDCDDRYLEQARWVAKECALEETLEFRKASVYELANWKETFDLVWFMGVFYHLRYPLLALDIVARKARKSLVFQTLEMPGNRPGKPYDDLPINRREKMLKPGWPKMAFIERKLANDWTNWWAPDRVCVEAMLRSCGLQIRDRPAPEIYICNPDHEREDWMDELSDSQFLSVFPSGISLADFRESCG